MLKFLNFFPKSAFVRSVSLRGVIASQSGRISSSETICIERVEPLLKKAFSPDKNLKAVAITINSPGGSAVQSGLVHDKIRALAKKSNIPVYVFCQDVAASGGYWIACAGDKIIANENSLVGSIGVIISSFGFKNAMEKLGIDRRLYTKGKYKALLDPFLPEDAEHKLKLDDYMEDVHQSFITHVRNRREGKLKEDPDLFSGLIWTGKRALQLGLIDELGDIDSVMKQDFGEDIKIVPIKSKSALLQKWLGMENMTSASLVDPGQVIQEIEHRAMWAKYGL